MISNQSILAINCQPLEIVVASNGRTFASIYWWHIYSSGSSQVDEIKSGIWVKYSSFHTQYSTQLHLNLSRTLSRGHEYVEGQRWTGKIFWHLEYKWYFFPWPDRKRRSFPFKYCWHSSQRTEKVVICIPGGLMKAGHHHHLFIVGNFPLNVIFVPWTCCTVPHKKEMNTTKGPIIRYLRKIIHLVSLLLIMRSHTMRLQQLPVASSHPCSKNSSLG